MYRKRVIAAIIAAAMFAGGAATSAVGAEPEPTDPPLGPPVVYDDPVGDVPEGPDFVACGVSEPWQSLVSFRLEFTEDPPCPTTWRPGPPTS